MSKQKYLGVAVAINGRVFTHPCDGTPEADRAAKARGDYPYTHLYEGDDICAIVAQMKEEDAARSTDNLVVAYHDGGLMFAGDDQDFPAGWYLYDGHDATPVTVLEPFSNTPMAVE